MTIHNFIAEGNIVPAPCPTGCKAGDLVIIDALVGVAVADTAAGDLVDLALTGAYLLPKSSQSEMPLGSKVYWCGVGCTNAAGESSTLVGIVVEAAEAGATVVRVRLSGTGA